MKNTTDALPAVGCIALFDLIVEFCLTQRRKGDLFFCISFFSIFASWRLGVSFFLSNKEIQPVMKIICVNRRKSAVK